MQGESAAVREWLATPLGRRVLANEQRLIRQALERVFGEQFLQIGAWGARNAFLRHARTQRRALLDWRPGVAADILSNPEQLAVASDSIDVVFLPHTLERTPSPHALLREVDRVLRPDGHLLVLSFAPGGFWGLRHVLSSRGDPACRERLIREGRLRDWLELLSFDVPPATRYCHTLPIERFKQLRILPREEWAQRWLPVFSGGYLIKAQKRVLPLTPVRAFRRQPRLRVVGGLVEPTTRAPVRIVPQPTELPKR
ncbi:MAG TPA: methyltransferase domain-containing protein [Gammaproteobacteria bacterium]|nr:methyltransferase domain-containing protein [Gammaproteobacteria bacterium]